MRFFEELTIGALSELGSHTFTADEIKTFAVRFDPQAFHVDEDAAARSHFGALCASGWHTAAVCMRHIVEARRREQEARHARGEPIARIGPSPGVRDLRWLKPVYAGDTVTFRGEITALAPLRRPGWGLVTALHTGTNQHGVRVMSFLGSVFVERKPA